MKWELDSIYTDKSFAHDLQKAKSLLHSHADLKTNILQVQEAGMILKEMDSFTSCLLAQNPADQNAQAKSGEVTQLDADYQSALFAIGNRLVDLDDAAFQALLGQLKDIAFFLAELREITKQKGPQRQEEMINSLSVDGYHSLWALYQTFTGKLKINGLSVGQAQNLMGVGDRSVRKKAFQDWTAAWKEQADFLAQLLNALAGFRLKVYATRGWGDVLHEPLLMNRMEPATFDAMWAAIVAAKPAFVQYMRHKAKKLGLEKLSWIDVEAPLAQVENISYEQGCDIILEQFEKFHPRMAKFAKMAFQKHWVEAEDRTGKAAGGFCVSFPKSNQSRIFMTYKGSPTNVATLAHELGHAYHNLCIEHLPFFHQQIQMNVAETASTFAEMVVIDQTIAEAKTEQEKEQLLDDKLQRSIAFFMNLHSRLIFERAFYAERKKGYVSAEKLCDLMEAAQREAYCGELADWDPYFWAWKLHFYFTSYPFYNFPYTFGYLMSNGLYALAKKDPNFGEKFDAFLSDTAQMSVEGLAKKHLNVDLTKPDFWKNSLDILVKDVAAFLS
ncbi:MAG: M3 family oligoendopeptidase [Verrucomicrobia bacterium]|nr:M3 family oligoendopeptidase [Verrucomicrobiota bacterium]